MGNPIDYWYQKYLALKAKMDEMTAGEEHLASVRKMSPNDLEEYASNAGFDYVDDIEAEEPGHRFNDHDVEYAYRDGIIAGAKWQKQHDSELIEIAYNDGITIGMTKQKEQMMKEAVVGVFLNNPYPTICLDDCVDYDFKDNQEIRLIIAKED